MTTSPRLSTRVLAALFPLFAVSCGNDRPAWAWQGAAQQDDASRLKRAADAYRTGKYDDAITLYGELSAKASATPASKRGLVRALAEVGRYREAEEAARRFVAGANGADVQNILGEVLAARGRLSEAEAAFKAAMSGRASDSLTARVNLAILRFDRGERAEAMREFDLFIDIYNQRRASLTSDELMAVGTACRYLGTQNPDLYKDALKALDAAIAADSTNLEAKLRVGELFLEKYNGADAKETLDEVLATNPSHPRALVAAARRLYFDGAPGANELVRKSLEVNPASVTARSFLAMLHLDTEDAASAAAEAERALQTDSTAPEALAALAATRYLQGDQVRFEDARRRALERNKTYADFFSTVAHVAARNRLYKQAVDLAREGTKVDPKSWRAHGLLGMNLLRVGQIEEGRQSLERAFGGDPYDVWIKNTLDLLDTFKGYKETRTNRFQFVIEAKDADLLTVYLGELAEEAYDKLAARYDYRPPTPIRLEVYRSHADFSVRTVGLAGLGALGVSFGTTLAMDSPAAREVGEFNWGSTFWHELAHTFTLGMTDHKVPRWLSEGISVYEERRARPSWGGDASLDFLAAFKAGKLVPVSRMNDGFMRPAYPQQIVFSYYQASLVCELIERDHGARALVDMLRGYKSGLSTPQIFQQVLKTDLAAFDKKFDDYIRQRFAKPLALVKPITIGEGEGDDRGVGGRRAQPVADAGEFTSKLREAVELYRAGKRDEALPLFEAAKALYPDYAGEHSPHWYLAQIQKQKGSLREAATSLAEITSRNENQYEANVEEASVREQLGDVAGAAAALDRAMFISPFDPALHGRLAELASKGGDRKLAVRERRAVVALAPVDRAQALYELARAYYEAGDVASARREVLRALEDAPNFEKAQELLLTLRRSPNPAGRGQP